MIPARIPDGQSWLETEPYFVYIWWRDDEPLYVGMTMDWRRRMREHFPLFFQGKPTDATYVDIWHVGLGRSDAERLEYELIRELDPSHNSTHSPRAEREAQAWAERSAEYEEWLKIPVRIREPDLWERMRRAVNGLPDITDRAS